MRFAIGACAVLAASGAFGDVNKCNVGGAVVFQDAPCPGATIARHDPSTPGQRPVAVKAPASSAQAAAVAASSNALKERLAVYERERHIREGQQQIEDLQRTITNRNDQMTRDLASLQAKKGRAANNLAGAQWEQSISSEMSAVTEKCRTLNDIDLQQIATLRAQLADLQRQ